MWRERIRTGLISVSEGNDDKPVFDSGMKYLEIGPLLSRGFREDGSPDMFTGTFHCMAAPEVDLDS